MPRVGVATGIPEDYPWGEWREMLDESPTKTLYFGPDDFSTHPETFAKKAKKYMGVGVYVARRGEEVMVTLNA